MPTSSPALLQEQAEKDLYAALQRFVPEANAQFDAGDYTASLQTLAVLRAPVDAFFDDVMVNAEQLDLRLNRQGLLKTLHVAMNRVADLARLAWRTPLVAFGAPPRPSPRGEGRYYPPWWRGQGGDAPARRAALRGSPDREAAPFHGP